MENLNELIRNEYSEYLRERLIIRKKDKSFEEVIAKLLSEYQVVEHIGNDMYRFKKMGHDSHWGVIRGNGEIVLKQNVAEVEEFKNGYAVIHFDMCHCNAIDKNGNLFFEKNLYLNNGYRHGRDLVFYNEYYTFNGTLYDFKGNSYKASEDSAGNGVIELADGMYGLIINSVDYYYDYFPVKKIVFPDKTIRNFEKIFCFPKARCISGIIDLEKGALDHNFQKIRSWDGNDYVRYQKTFMGYKYYSSKDNKEYSLKHKPILDVGDYILCCNVAYTFLYNKKTKMYEMFFNEPINNDFSFDDGTFISTKYNLKFYFVGDNVIDISYLDEDEIVVGKSFDGDMLSFSDFEEKIMEDEAVIKILKDKATKKTIALEHANATILQNEVDNRRQNILNAIEVLQRELVNLENYSSVQKRSVIAREVLLEDKDGYFEVKPIFKNLLSFFDLSQVDFTDVNIAGLDLSYTGANINPQKIYNKDMSNGIYKNISFLAFDFTGVNLCGADLSECNLDFAILDSAITDENTKLPSAPSISM